MLNSTVQNRPRTAERLFLWLMAAPAVQDPADRGTERDEVVQIKMLDNG
jgi:hypothetical protein